jgi:hypothetical protein
LFTGPLFIVLEAARKVGLFVPTHNLALIGTLGAGILGAMRVARKSIPIKDGLLEYDFCAASFSAEMTL